MYQLQVGAEWGALAAGTAMLPATLVMLVGSERSGALATRIGPRPQLVLGPALVALGFVVLARIDEDASWATDVLPGALLFGLGTVCFVAPLTAAVMGSVDQQFVTTASGVNSAIARTGGLIAIAVIPNLVGLPSAASGPEATAAYQRAMYAIAGLALVSSLIAFVGLRQPRVRASARRFHCSLDGPPLQPDPTQVR